jgi:hypothetical protein
MIFSRDEISVSKTKKTSRKLGVGIAGELTTEISAPAIALSAENYARCNNRRLHARVTADLSWPNGLRPAKSAAVWFALGGTELNNPTVIGRWLTHAQAVEACIDWVYSANPSEGGEA